MKCPFHPLHKGHNFGDYTTRKQYWDWVKIFVSYKLVEYDHVFSAKPARTRFVEVVHDGNYILLVLFKPLKPVL